MEFLIYIIYIKYTYPVQAAIIPHTKSRVLLVAYVMPVYQTISEF